MSKFKDTPPSAPDDKVIPFPASGEMTVKQRKAELDAFDRAADDELMLRMRYRSLLQTLDTIEKYDPVPDDWRAKLEGREPLDLVSDEEDDDDLDDLDDEDDEDEDDL